jgi:hypothetical protein
LQFNYAVKREEGKVELYIDRGAGRAKANKSIFDQLQKQKAVIEREFGDELSWQRLDGKQSCRIAYAMTGGGWKSEESKWPAIQDAMIDAMMRLEQALRPHIEELKNQFPADA